jgi:acetyltransferase-like isoleucine patch superfamily enzyme
LVALKNRLLQIAALYAPGAKTVRVRLHRMRGVRIGEDVFLGLGVILESGYPRMVSIGSHVTISVRSVVIAHFAGSARWARSSDEPSVRIEDNVYIGPGVVILPNVTIGQGAVVAAGSVVSQSVPPGVMVQGNPAKPIAKCGVPLKGNTYEQFLRGLKFIDD